MKHINLNPIDISSAMRGIGLGIMLGVYLIQRLQWDWGFGFLIGTVIIMLGHFISPKFQLNRKKSEDV